MRSLVAALLLAVPGVVAAQEVGLDLGTKAPPAAVQTLDGKPTDLAQFVGTGPVLIEFWATWCPNCRALEPQMVAAAKKYAGRVRFVTVAVSVNQTPERVKAYVARHTLPGTFVYDKSGAASGAYDAPATSYIVVLDKSGKVVYTGQGAEQNIEAAIRKAL